MNTLFGVDLPTSVTFIIAFVVVLVLIGAAAWVVRKFGAGRLAAGRGRQPRLAVIDAAAVDGRRKLIIIRRDNVEHLLMIGGPSDVVVETNILRAAPAAQREAPAVRAPTEAASPRATPLSDAPPWPPQTEPVAAPPRAERPRLLPEESAAAPMSIPMTIPPQPAPAIIPPLRVVAEPARPQASADPLMGLAAELSRSKIEPIARPPEPPRVVIPLAPAHSDSDSPIMPAPPSVAASAPISPDVHLAEMAQRLETALRRPLAQKREEPKRVEKSAPVVNPPTNGGAPNGATAKTAYADLEQEMASLLGRQPGKT